MITPLTTAALHRYSSDELRVLLAEAVAITAQGLGTAAAILAEMENRGDDTSQFRTGLFAFLRDIAAGRLSPDLVVRYAGKLSLLRHLASLPATDQQHITRSGSVPVVEMIGGRLTEHHVRLDRLTGHQMRRILRPEGVANGVQQRRLLHEEKRVAAGGSPRPRTSSDNASSISIRLPLVDADTLKEHAHARGISVNRLIADTLHKAGLLSR